jgi:hypothetical protein
MTRLDEKSARRIAAGRLDAIAERVDAALSGLATLPSKPEVRARAIQASLQRAFGDWFLASGRLGRNLLFQFAQPGEQAGWVDIVMVHYSLRSVRPQIFLLAKISAHATARLLERRRDVDIERLLRDELSGEVLVGLVDAWIKRDAEDIRLPTTNGEFRFTRDDEEQTLIATTWVVRKSD